MRSESAPTGPRGVATGGARAAGAPRGVVRSHRPRPEGPEEAPERSSLRIAGTSFAPPGREFDSPPPPRGPLASLAPPVATPHGPSGADSDEHTVVLPTPRAS